MTNKKLWCGILIAALTLALTVVLPLPARAATAETVLIAITATTLAAAIAVVTVATIHHRRRKIAITGCMVSVDKAITVIDEEDKKRYLLSGDITGIRPGDRMSLEGKKAKSSDKALVWEVKAVIKDFGKCPAGD
jgi:hypothetical protein